jgi:hypothetical protein
MNPHISQTLTAAALALPGPSLSPRPRRRQRRKSSWHARRSPAALTFEHYVCFHRTVGVRVHGRHADPHGPNSFHLWHLLYVFFPVALFGLVIARLFVGGNLAAHFVHLLVAVAIVLVFAPAQMYAVQLSMKRVSPRPRWHYLLFCIGYVIVAVVAAAIGGWADSDHLGWLSNAMVWLVGLALGGAFVMLGRGVFRGRVRRSFWRIPPPWLDEEFHRSTK